MSEEFLRTHRVPLEGASSEERSFLFAETAAKFHSRGKSFASARRMRFRSQWSGAGGGGGGGGAASTNYIALNHTPRSLRGTQRQKKQQTRAPSTASAIGAQINRCRDRSFPIRTQYKDTFVVRADRAGILFGYRGTTLKALRAEYPNVEITITGEWGGDQTVHLSAGVLSDLQAVSDAVRGGWRPWSSRWGFPKSEQPSGGWRGAGSAHATRLECRRTALKKYHFFWAI